MSFTRWCGVYHLSRAWTCLAESTEKGAFLLEVHLEVARKASH
jgi:hypothetical protein